MGYAIVGDTENYKGYLVCVVKGTREDADKALSQMLNTPTANDKFLMKGLINLRVVGVETEDCWWEHGTD